jgi:hypothetical protein
MNQKIRAALKELLVKENTFLTFQRRSKDSEKSPWKRRTFACIETYDRELTATDG